MDASIIICTRNRAGFLRETLAALLATDVPAGLRCELLVVDNGSNDDTRAVVDGAKGGSLETRYLFHSEPGKCSALNAGIAAARGELLVFTDDDVRPRERWLGELISPLQTGAFDAVAGEVCIAQHLLRPWMTEKHRFLLASTEFLSPENPESAVGANMAFTRRVLQKVPRFDPQLGVGKLGFWDDTLFIYQLREAGFRLGMALNSVMEHHFDPARLSRAAFLDRARKEGRSRAYVSWHWKHEEPPRAGLKRMLMKTELFMNRTFQSKRARTADEIAGWELDLVRDIAFLDAFSALRGQPRVYSKRGLARLA